MTEGEGAMNCWCGHGPWHHYGYAYPPPYGPPAAYPPPADYYYGGPARRRRRRDPEELEEYLEDLEAEIARVRQELGDLRERRAGEG
jgi:hypothetical protein